MRHIWFSAPMAAGNPTVTMELEGAEGVEVTFMDIGAITVTKDMLDEVIEKGVSLHT